MVEAELRHAATAVEESQALERRRLGRTGMQVTAISFGGGGIGGRGRIDDDDIAASTIIRGWQRGIEYFDVAPSYGESERRFGEAFRRLSGKPAGLYLSTKTKGIPSGDYSAAATQRSVENSLKVLGVDSVDIVYVHSPPSMEPVLASGGALEGLERMRDEGKLRWIGLGVREHHKHRTAIKSRRFDVLLTYADYNLVRQTSAPLIAEAAAAGLPVVLGQVFLFGMLAGREPVVGDFAGRWYSDYLVPDVPCARGWWRWARDRGIPLRAVALQYALRNPLVGNVMVGAQSPEEIDGMLDAAVESITDEIWAEVDQRISDQANVQGS